MEAVPVFFAPDIDTSWSVSPGALAELNAFAPLQLGAYGSMGAVSYASGAVTGKDHLAAYIFRKVDGTCRFLTFRSQDIDEYDSSITKTNRGTGYSVSTSWSAAAWGNQIIACNYLDATQSSTGAGFTALGGSCPKARCIAANLSFVMVADVDDGGSNVYSDMVWWSALQNPASWTPSLATQAGNIRLLDAPGPIRALVPFRDMFVAFKDNAIFVGEYVGPQQFIFQWRLVSSKIGCIAPKGVAELDGKLYFMHTSGIYEFDGNNLRNVSIQVFQSLLTESGYITRVVGDTSNQIGASFTISSISTAQAVADDIEGIVWFSVGYYDTNAGDKYSVMYGYNPRCGKWGRRNARSASGDNDSHAPDVLVRASFVDIQTFKAHPTARFLVLVNGTTNNDINSIEYPVVTSVPSTGTVTAATARTGVIGANAKSQPLSRVHYRTLTGTDDDSGITVVATGYTSENKNKTNGSKTLSYNAEFDVADGVLSSKFQTLKATWSTGKKVILAGMSPEYVGESRR